MSELTYAYVGDVVKHEEDSNGDLYVYGTATSSALDGDQQRCSPEWLKSAMPAWWLWKNVREQHSPIAAGVGVQLTEEADDNDRWQLKSLVVDAGTKEKVKKGVLKGYSVGIRGAKISKSADAPGGIIDSGEIVEISLVDRPCNSDCGISIAKSAGGVLAPVDAEGDSVVRAGDSVSIVKGEAILESATLQKTPMAKPTPLNMPGAVKAVATAAEAQQAAEKILDKATDVDQIDAPNHSQTCVRCAEPGHLWCAPEGFDKDFAVSLVNQAIEKAADGDESADIDGARKAITIIGTLIASEAAELAEKADQSWDIRLLLQAASSLHSFICREQMEQAGDDSDAMVCLSAQPDAVKSETPIWFADGPDALPVSKNDRGDVVKSKYDAKQMAQMLSDGVAMANANGDPSYPIKDAVDLENAIHAVGRGKSDHTAIRKHIVKRARALGLESKLPATWNVDSSASIDSGKSLTAGATVTVTIDGKSFDAVIQDVVSKALTPIEDATPTTEAPSVEAVEKAVAPETPVDAEEADAEKTTAPDLVKTLTGALKDETSELRELFKSILRDDTTAKALETTQVTLGDISARLEQVEKMAAPGGPALRRTDAEVKKSREADLLLQAEVEDRKAGSTYDNDLKQGYLLKASSLRAQARAIAA